MKAAKIIVPLALLFTVTACSKSSHVSKVLEIPLHECRPIDNNKLQLCYDSIIADSRCPINMYCVWQGIGITRLTFRSGTKDHILTLATYDFQNYRKDTTIGGYTIELVDMLPYPGTTPASEYSVKLKVVKK